MSANKIYICGTLRVDRKSNPKDIVNKKLKKGEYDWKRNKTVVVCEWKDKRYVLFISSKHKIEMVQVNKKRGEGKLKPNTVNYNNCMSGIDRSDQMLSYYQGLQKSIRWYKKIGFRYIEMFLQNALYLHNMLTQAVI